jgi:hypothetical protein
LCEPQRENKISLLFLKFISQVRNERTDVTTEKPVTEEAETIESYAYFDGTIALDAAVHFGG